jgi:hypothetical protein
MRQTILAGTFMCLAAGASAQTAIPLSTYADARGYLDVQVLTCAHIRRTRTH